MRIPEDTAEFAINMSNQRHWEAPMQRYVGDLLAGKTGPRGTDFNMRWVASMVADVHRILTRGGIFIYPLDAKIEIAGRQAAADVRGQPDGLHRRAGRRRGDHRTRADHGHRADAACTSACRCSSVQGNEVETAAKYHLDAN